MICLSFTTVAVVTPTVHHLLAVHHVADHLLLLVLHVLLSVLAEPGAVDLDPLLFHIPGSSLHGKVHPWIHVSATGRGGRPSLVRAAKDGLVATGRLELTLVHTQSRWETEGQLWEVLVVSDTQDDVHTPSTNFTINADIFEWLAGPGGRSN